MNGKLVMAATLAASVLVSGVALARAASEKATVSGEVIDSACYIKMGAKGPDHAQCAESCAKAGIPLALLTDDGKVVWLASNKDMESANGVLMPYVAKKVTLEGTWYERGGTKLFAIDKVTPVK